MNCDWISAAVRKHTGHKEILQDNANINPKVRTIEKGKLEERVSRLEVRKEFSEERSGTPLPQR